MIYLVLVGKDSKILWAIASGAEVISSSSSSLPFRVVSPVEKSPIMEIIIL